MKPRTVTLRKPYKTTILVPPDFLPCEAWIVGRKIYGYDYEGRISKLLVQLPDGTVIEVEESV